MEQTCNDENINTLEVLNSNKHQHEEEEEKQWYEDDDTPLNEGDDKINFNDQEIEDFFGVDMKEMERLVKVSKKYLNNVHHTDRNFTVNKEDEMQLSSVKFVSGKNDLMDHTTELNIIDKANSENIQIYNQKSSGKASKFHVPSTSVRQSTISPFNGIKQPSSASIETLSLQSKLSSSVRSGSSGNKHLKLRIQDIIFRELDLQDIIYLTVKDEDFIPPKFIDIAENIEIDLSDWREQIKQLNKDNALIEGIIRKTYVGFVCLYNQSNYLAQIEKQLYNEDGTSPLMNQGYGGEPSSQRTIPITMKNSLAKRYEGNVLIGIILLKMMKPCDTEFPQAFRELLPIFSKFKPEEKTQKKDVQQQREADDLENPLSNIMQSQKQTKLQAAKILYISVVPQCKRSGIGSLLYLKVLHLIQNQYRDCVLIYASRLEEVKADHKSLTNFFLKNHFNVINEVASQRSSSDISKKQNNDINSKSLFYYPIKSLENKDHLKTTYLIFAELIKVVCKNPFAQCHREGKRKFKKDLQKIKQKYEKEGVYIDIINGEDEGKGHAETEERKREDVFEIGSNNVNNLLSGATNNKSPEHRRDADRDNNNMV